MTVQPDADRFLERFRAFGAQPDVARYLALFHPDATLFDSGMERPITVPEIPEHIEAILKLVPASPWVDILKLNDSNGIYAYCLNCQTH